MPLLFQAGIGVYLKLHIHEQTVRPWAVLAHGIVYVLRLPVVCAIYFIVYTDCVILQCRGKSFPVLGWVQMLFGAILLGDYCHGEELGQCLGTCHCSSLEQRRQRVVFAAHYIMGRLSGMFSLTVQD